MPGWCLLLQALERLGNHTLQDEATYMHGCALCEKLAGSPYHAAKLKSLHPELHLHGCGSCAMTWHYECARGVNAASQDELAATDLDFVCPFCWSP